MTHLPLGIAVSLLLGALPGQERIAIPASHVNREGSTSTNVPFGRSGPMRAQLVYDRSLFSAPVVIEEVAFRGNGGEVVLAKQVELELRMSTLPGSILATQPQFAKNRGDDEVVVFDRRDLTLPGHDQVQVPNPFHLRLPLDRGFTYDPAVGSLVLEVIVYDQEPGRYSLDATYVCASPPEAVGPPPCQTANGPTVKVESVTTQVMWGRALVFRVFDARIGTPTGLLLGTRDTGTWNGWELPVDLGFVGAPGCFASISIDVAVNETADGSGSATYTFSIPTDPALQGLWIYFQGAAMDMGANPLGVVTSQAARVQICGWEPVARIYANNLASTTGFREIGLSPVIELSIR